ncbi:MAG: cyclic nucleotide-binding domain-containing protein [Pseudomonadota bacterium]
MDDLAALAAITSEREVAPGEIIYHEGDAGDAMFIIVDGEVELLKGGSPFLKFHSGETLGQVSFMDGGPRPVTARVVPGPLGVHLLVIERTAFMDLLSDRFELVTGLFAVLAQRLRTLIELTGQHGDSPPQPPERRGEASDRRPG